MADIFHDFPIKSPVNRVFEAVSTPGGLDQWWTKRSAGHPTLGAEFELWFGPKYDWRAKVASASLLQNLSLKSRKPTRTGSARGSDSN